MAVYDDVRGWNTDQYIGSGEFYLEYGNFDVTITTPAAFTVTATGTLQNPNEVLPAAIRTRLAAAAKSDSIVRIITPAEVGTAALLPPHAGATRTWRWHADNVRDFAWATAPNYLWDASSWDGILMQAFYPPDQLATWKNGADITRHAVMYHSRWFHYPYPSAVSAQGPVGGMEYPMMTFDDAENEEELYYTIAHEQGHEWFPMIVGSQERLYPWMDEGFNTFIDIFAFRDRYPGDTMRVQSLEFGSMRAYQGFLARGFPETPIMEAQDRSPNGLMSGWNAYGKPAVALHFLREQVVDSTAFDSAFVEYTRRWAFRHPMPADFFRSMNDGLGEDLSWFWRGWFVTTDHLDQAIDSVLVSREQRPGGGASLPLEPPGNGRPRPAAGHHRGRGREERAPSGRDLAPRQHRHLADADAGQRQAGPDPDRPEGGLPGRQPGQQRVDGTNGPLVSYSTGHGPAPGIRPGHQGIRRSHERG